MEFSMFARTATAEVYLILGDNGEEIGEASIIYGEMEVQALAGISGDFSEEERDEIDLELANFVENLATAADVDYFQLNIYASANMTTINNFDEDFDDDEDCHTCGCQE